jgi:hypothetical protein
VSLYALAALSRMRTPYSLGVSALLRSASGPRFRDAELVDGERSGWNVVLSGALISTFLIHSMAHLLKEKLQLTSTAGFFPNRCSNPCGKPIPRLSWHNR